MKRFFAFRIYPAFARCLIILGLLSLGHPSAGRTAALSQNVQPAAYNQPAAHAPQSVSPRRVNIPYYAGDVTWAETGIFWFGVNDQTLPGRNYLDVRVAYTHDALRIEATVIDYYLWQIFNATPQDDLTQYDAIAIYLDTNHDRAATPQNDDYTFLLGAHYDPVHDTPQYRRQARGTGAGWDNTWAGSWVDDSGAQWAPDGAGPNNNSLNIDYGWVLGYTIPWSTLGLSGPPDAGTLWGLGVLLYDRDDQPPAGYVAPEGWPETFNADSPATWGEMHFGYASYQPPAAIQRGTTVIQSASQTDNTIEDSWNGGGGNCIGGHMGHGNDNNGDDTNLFVESQTAAYDFPCFSKTYMRFHLGSIPQGKVIISATLTLHLWGNAGYKDGDAKPSWIYILTVTDPWDEMGINWNNAPLAQANVSASWVYPIPGNIAPWPGIPYDWDMTEAVAEAYAQGQPASIAMYGSDSEMHSSKYFTSSEMGDWDAEGRPRLAVVWGDPLAAISNQVTPSRVTNGDTATYTLNWQGVGQSQMLTDTLPAGLSDPGMLEASSGTVNYDSGTRQITWAGAPDTGQPVTITYTVTVQVSGPVFLTNTAILASPAGSTSATATLAVDSEAIYLPFTIK